MLTAFLLPFVWIIIGMIVTNFIMKPPPEIDDPGDFVIFFIIWCLWPFFFLYGLNKFIANIIKKLQ